MRRSRWTIAGLMTVVFGVAVGFAALKSPSEAWVRVIWASVLVLLVGATIGAARREGGKRAFWTGFAVAGWSYAIVCLVPGVSRIAEPRLPTSAWLERLHPLFCGPRFARLTLSLEQFNSDPLPKHPFAPVPTVRIVAARAAPRAFVLSWQNPTLEHFRRIGHGLFTLIFAALVGLLARWLAQRLGRREPVEP